MALKFAPLSPVTLTNRAMAYADRRDTAHAFADFAAALQSDPRYATAYFRRGQVYRDSGNIDQAFAEFATALQIRPDYAEVYNERGTLFHARGDDTHAIADFSSAIMHDPSYATAYNNRGAAYDGWGYHFKAIADFDEAVRLAPNYASAYDNRGYAKDGMGDHEAAMADYARAIELAPDLASPYANRGVSRFALGQFADAADDFAKLTGIERTIYDGLWLYLARARAGIAQPDDLTRILSSYGAKEWPAVVAQLFMGQGSETTVYAAARSDPATATARLCETEFFLGERALLANNMAQAKARFARVLDGCSVYYYAYRAAAGELARLRTASPPPSGRVS
jgi:lipoprotein NlpI